MRLRGWLSTMAVHLVCLLLVGVARAQKFNHEPGETWEHFRTVEKLDDQCLAGVIRDPEPGQCAAVPWAGKVYLFNNGVLYRSQVHLGMEYEQVVALLKARYGEPTSRQKQFEMIDGRVSTFLTWFKAPRFDVFVYRESYVDDGGNSQKATYIVSTNETRTKKPKDNTHF
jgi:hypothetical protein